MIRFIVGVALAIGAWMGGFLLEGGNPASLLGLSAFLITVLVPFFSILSVWSWGDWSRAWSHAFTKAKEPAQAKTSVEIWKFAETSSYIAGILGWMTGAVLILGNFPLPPEPFDWVRFGKANAAGLIAPMYGIVLGFISRILQARVKSIHS